MRVPYQDMYDQFLRVLLKYGFTEEKAKISAKLYADASRDGVYTHGLNRFVKFIKSIHDGIVDIHAEPRMTASLGALERYDGQHGPGNLNAYACTRRAIELAKKNTIGCVALSNTNHWMRPGNYGLMAVEQNCIGIFWTNTVPNMPRVAAGMPGWATTRLRWQFPMAKPRCWWMSPCPCSPTENWKFTSAAGSRFRWTAV